MDMAEILFKGKRIDKNRRKNVLKFLIFAKASQIIFSDFLLNTIEENNKTKETSAEMKLFV